jgi:uncharacterized protein (DUF1778 family)
MANISLQVPDKDLALIDAQAGKGNRTAFMVAAAVARAKAVRRERIDQEIIAAVQANEEADYAVYKDWECTMNDGLEDV